MITSSSVSSKPVTTLFSILVFSIVLASSNSIHSNFLQCLSLNTKTPIPVYSPDNVNYTYALQFSIQNLRLLTPTTPKPNLIITPLNESHVQVAVICSRKHGIHIKIRSGGHDYDGLSYVSDVPFVIVDLSNLRSISFDAENNTAWVQSGATIGEVYYKVGVRSRTLAFPAGICPTIGIGGHFSGGGHGSLLRMYGLAADNVIDAKIVDLKGRILDKESMGDDLFWAIRGGGGSFGVILSWKIRLVHVPPIVTIFTIVKTIAQNATALVHRWQEVAPKLPEELFIRVILVVVNANQNGEKTIQASFNSMFLGSSDSLQILMKEKFPELGLERKDCIELSWIQSILYFNNFPINSSLEILLDRAQPKRFYKAKSDYVQQPIPQIGLEGMWRRLFEEDQPVVIFSPYGGRMDEISESELPFPHRKGNLFEIQYLAYWEGSEETEKHLSWIRKLYIYMAPYVSKSPRAAYLNYRDIDIGQSKNGTSTYLQGKVWGDAYFKNNYERLVKVKSKVDLENFFRNEQSIPSVASSEN